MTFKELYGDMSNTDYKGNLDCSNNPKLTLLEGAPKKVGVDFNCRENPKLNSLDELIYNETEIKGEIFCDEKLQKEADAYNDNLKLFKKLGKNKKKYKAMKDLESALGV
jgi:hypothetical protein